MPTKRALDWEKMDREKIDWDKGNGLLPAIIQDADDGRVLMLGYMNSQALAQTKKTNLVTFYSRSKQRLWVKGEVSGNHLTLVRIAIDCDGDTLLIRARPFGPVCHTGLATCFTDPDNQDDTQPASDILSRLATIIRERQKNAPLDSYTANLFTQGVKRIAQKVGEEGLETALAAVAGDQPEVIEESADLLYHLLVLLRQRDIEIDEVLACLAQRMKKT